jgi:hypothetical protein
MKYGYREGKKREQRLEIGDGMAIRGEFEGVYVYKIHFS